jgi:hypothetical protein
VTAALPALPSIRVLPTIRQLGHGLHYDVLEHVYHSSDISIASASGLKLLGDDSSPLHFYEWATSGGKEETDALMFGRAYHAACLEPERFAREWVTLPNLGDPLEDGSYGTYYRTKAAKARRDEWVASHPNTPNLTEEQIAQVRAMVRAVQAHPEASTLLEDGASEVTIRWRDAASGVECKARVDHLSLDIGCAADLKSTEDASARGFTRACENFGYALQASFYLSGLAALGIDAGFRFVPVEKSAPHGVAIYKISDTALAKAYEVNARRLDLLARCLESGEWPSYPPGTHEIEPRIFG